MHKSDKAMRRSLQIHFFWPLWSIPGRGIGLVAHA